MGYPQRVEALLTERVDIQNAGEPGLRMSAINSGKAFTLVYSYRSDYAKNIVHIFAGTNDLNLLFFLALAITAATMYTIWRIHCVTFTCEFWP